MLILLALLCADPTGDYETEMRSAKDDVIADGRRIADTLKPLDEPAMTHVLSELQFFLSREQLPSSPHLLWLRDNYVAARAVARYKLLQATPEDKRNSLLSEWAKGETRQPPIKRQRWVSSFGSRFQHMLGNRWVEFSAKGERAYEFREAGKTHDYVEIYDPTRRATVRIHDTKTYFSTEPKIWSELHDGRWAE